MTDFDPDSVSKAIAKAEEDLRAAMLASDVAALDTLLEDGVVVTNQDGVRLTKAEDLAVHASGQIKIERLDGSNLTVRALDAATAIALVDVALAGSYAGQPFLGEFAYTRVWRREGDVWRVAAAHGSARLT